MILLVYAVGHLIDKEKYITQKTFSMLNKEQQEIVIDERLGFLLEVLKILEDEKILLINKLNFNVSGVGDEYFLGNSKYDSHFRKFKSDILHSSSGDLSSLKAEGSTIINTQDGEVKGENIMTLFYRFNGNGIEITTYSDLWSPVDLDDNYQIDLAVLNNSRLERCLQKIKALGGYASIYPDEGEFGEDKLSQFGFRVITYQGDITEWDDFPKGREEEVKPFIWKYISSP